MDQVLARVPRVTNENVLVGFDTADDAGVVRLTPDCALVQTTDFFTPIVDDPATYGAIAAANALSDVYAMGGKPLSALSLVCYPGGGDVDDLAEILQGGAAKMAEAGCAIVGGHSVSDPEIKFGYAVTGTVHPDHIWTNTGARPGDVLVFTKCIGTGIISTALKRGIASQEHVAVSIESMLTLNRAAADALFGREVHACTDVTGFGVLGHARELALGSKATLVIDAACVRFLPGAEEYSKAGAIPGGLKNNRKFVECAVALRRELPEEIVNLLYDPQTSGGLLVSLPQADAGVFLASYEGAYRIGRVEARAEAPIVLE